MKTETQKKLYHNAYTNTFTHIFIYEKKKKLQENLFIHPRLIKPITH